MSTPPLALLLRMHAWAGTLEHPCTLVGETRCRLRVVFAAETRLPGGRVAAAGSPVLIPRGAARLAS